MSYEFIDTLPDRLRTGAYGPLFEACMKNPGKWTMVKEVTNPSIPHSYLSQWRKSAVYSGFPMDDFVASVRTGADGVSRFFLKYDPS